MTGKEGHRAANYPLLYGPRALPSPWPKRKVASVSERRRQLAEEKTLPLRERRDRKNPRLTKETTDGLKEAIDVSQTLFYGHYRVVKAFIP